MEKIDNIQQKIKAIDFAFWAGVVFFAVVIGLICSFGLFLQERLSEDESVPVTSIVVLGEMTYTEKVDVENAIDKIGVGNFFKVNVNTIQKAVKNLPWVYSVSVRKQWPNELKLYVVDQKPIARWNADSYINVYGEVFQVNGGKTPLRLPNFYGPEGTEDIALENFKNLNKLLHFGGFNISELVLSERYAWQLTLTSGVTLNLGRENRVERIQRFMDAYSKIEPKKDDLQIDYVDLRYDTGFAVGFKSTNTKERV